MSNDYCKIKIELVQLMIRLLQYSSMSTKDIVSTHKQLRALANDLLKEQRNLKGE